MLLKPLFNGIGSNIENENSSVRRAYGCVLAAPAEGRSGPITSNMEFVIPV